MDEENELNLKILNISMQIKLHNPELSKYLDEMTVTIPNEKHPTINIIALKSYYDSLLVIWNNYLTTHS
jgi:hypothetical protein